MLSLEIQQMWRTCNSNLLVSKTNKHCCCIKKLISSYKQLKKKNNCALLQRG